VNTYRKIALEINCIYLGNKEIYCIFKTCCIISVLFSTKCCLFHNFIFSCSKITFFINHAINFSTHPTRIKVKVGVLWAIIATKLIGPIFYSGFQNLSEEENEYKFFQQDSAAAHTAINSMGTLLNIFGTK
jgi:hypothetical protein